MARISKEKQEKIIEQVLEILFLKNPEPIFTSKIAQELARDEEFIKNLLINMKKSNLVVEIKKNSHGELYKKRSRWQLSDEVYLIYKKRQTQNT
ncbi:MAG: hypothetical protein QXX55_01830 [Candidatus Pacearchaeota archaeon]